MRQFSQGQGTPRANDALRDFLVLNWANPCVRKGPKVPLAEPPDGVFLSIFGDRTIAELVVKLKILAACNERALTLTRRRIGLVKLGRAVITKVAVEPAKGGYLIHASC